MFSMYFPPINKNPIIYEIDMTMLQGNYLTGTAVI